MRRTITAGTASLLVVASTIWGPGASARPQSRTIAGVVVDVGCLPLPGVIVRLGAQATVTDERGHFAVVANESPAVLTARLEGFRRGRVLDAQCRPLSGATVRALSERQIRRTDADGRFEFTSITSGSPAIEVIATGFVTTEVKDVRMDEKNTGYVDVPMDVGVVRDRVTVSGR